MLEITESQVGPVDDVCLNLDKVIAERLTNLDLNHVERQALPVPVPARLRIRICMAPYLLFLFQLLDLCSEIRTLNTDPDSGLRIALQFLKRLF